MENESVKAKYFQQVPSYDTHIFVKSLDWNEYMITTPSTGYYKCNLGILNKGQVVLIKNVNQLEIRKEQ